MRAGDPTGRLSILGFTDPLFARLLHEVSEEDRARQMHIVDERGRVHSGGDALIILMAMQPATRRRARLARVWPPLRRKIREEYVALAARRGELSDRVGDVATTSVPPRWTRLP